MVNELLIIAFSLLPGKTLQLKKENSDQHINWEVFTDAYNRAYIYCKYSSSYAYFVNDGTMFYFTDFEGDKRSLLFHFYLAVYRQLLGYYDKIKITDNIPLIHFNNRIVKLFQDFLAPFYLFTKAEFSSNFTFVDNVYAPQRIIINSAIKATITNITFKKNNYELELKDSKIQRFTIKAKNKTETYFFIN